MKTNAARLLDKAGIAYRLRTSEVDPEDLSAQTVAAKIGLPPEQVFKTLVLRGDRTGNLFAVIPGNTEADEKAIARLKTEELLPLSNLNIPEHHKRKLIMQLQPDRPGFRPLGVARRLRNRLAV